MIGQWMYSGSVGMSLRLRPLLLGWVNVQMGD